MLAIAFGREEGPGESVLEAFEQISGRASRAWIWDPRGREPSREPEGPFPLEGALGDGRFQLLREIVGREASALFEGRDRILGRRLALEVLRPEQAQDAAALWRFLAVAQLEGQLQHPGVAPVYSLGLTPDQRPFVARRILEGETLAGLLAGGGGTAWNRRQLLGILEQVCQTLAYAHARGVVHGSLDPSKVFVGAYGEVLVAGWEVALGPGMEGWSPHFRGDPAYIAPELGQSPPGTPDARADVYSLGILLGRILAMGLPPPEPPAPSGQEHEEELAALARACLSPCRENRPTEAGVLARAVAAYLSALEERARQAELEAAEQRARALQERAEERHASRRAAWERRARRRSLALAAAGAAILLMAGGGYLWKEQELRSATSRTALAVAEALQDSARHEGAGRWSEALRSARTAVSLARAGPANPALLEGAGAQLGRVEAGEEAASAAAREAAAEAALRERLTGIRTQAWVDPDPIQRDATWAAAFREWGIDGEGPGPYALPKVPPGGPIAVQLATALDQWASLRRTHPLLKEKEWLPLLRVARALDPDPWRIRLRRAIASPLSREELRLLAGQWDPARLPAATFHLLALNLEHAGDPMLAASVLQEARRHHPRDFWIQAELGQLHARKGHLEDALPCWQAALALRPDSAFLWAHLGRALAREGRRDAALRSLRKAADLQPGRAEHRLSLAGLLREAGDPAGALAELRRALQAEPGSREALGELSFALLELGKWEEALPLLAHAAASGPEEARAQEVLYRKLTLLADPDRLPPAGLPELGARLVEQAPEWAPAWVLLGLCRFRGRDLPGAVQTLERSLALHSPEHPLPWLLLALAHAQLGHPSDAHECYRRAEAWLRENPAPEPALRRLQEAAQKILEAAGKEGG